jgi:hypothetical protein
MNINYSVCGSVEKTDGGELRIVGTIVIDDILRGWTGSISNPEDPAQLPLECKSYSYFIPEYSICLISDSLDSVERFSGTGALDMERSVTDDAGLCEWFLGDGTPNWGGMRFEFYNEDLSECQQEYYFSELAPFIRFSGLQIFSRDDVKDSSIDIMLTKIGPIPSGKSEIKPPINLDIE